ncbi:MAG: phosphatidylserine decarboxylase [Simkania sp.]|nr:phosphatidylserine decarboxylase [Simkania sp.]
MNNIHYLDRETGKVHKEKIYGKFFIEALYGTSILSKFFSWIFLPLISRSPFFSLLYGRKQKSAKSRKKVIPFIEMFHVDASEFLKSPHEFTSFNDFFIRKLKPTSRPIAKGNDVAILPADGRHLFYPSFGEAEGFYVKGRKFDLELLLQDDFLFDIYKRGSMVISRLCPTDYHRYHFPCECIPTKAKLINGPLYSVNPMALRKNIMILNENKRMLTQLKTKTFGTILFIEVGATFVGSIKQTYSPQSLCKKGQEKGYFEFGGSCIIMLFTPGAIVFDEDLIASSKKQIEVKAKMGEQFGRATQSLGS